MGQTRWLTPREERVWRLFAAALVYLPDEVEAPLQRDADLTHFGYAVLSALSEAPGRALRMSDLAYMAQGSRSRLSHVVANLERRGWVRRERDTADGRSNIATLTDVGYAKIVAIAPSHLATVRATIFDALGAQQLDELEGICMALLPPEIRDRQTRRHPRQNDERHQADDVGARPHIEDTTDVTDALARVSAARADIDLTELQLIDSARAQGQTWEQIAAALGMPDRRQAQTRFRRLRERWPEYEPTGL
ncbi:MarR family winged helix-turn-helix transcriptional regulator [Actinophytocola sp.]|uniref:MarR family winged helix-turn-helix transcriptional regulator n=1 Tax=Actinophytocola sp. TaxID=1872138 RepID=UPI002ED1AF88